MWRYLALFPWILGAQGWETLRDSLLIENERLEELELEQRPFPTLPILERPRWKIEDLAVGSMPDYPTLLPMVLQPSRPAWKRLAPIHLSYSLGRYWTQRLYAVWNRTRDTRTDRGVALTHFSTPQGHVKLARWGHTHLEGWWGLHREWGAWEARYRGGYEKYFYYAPYAEGWTATNEKQIPDSLRGHFWRQELSLRLLHVRAGRGNLTTRRLDWRRGAPEWLLQAHWESKPYVSPIGRIYWTGGGFVEGQRFLLQGGSWIEQDSTRWQVQVGAYLGIGKDSLMRFWAAPHLYCLYKGFPAAARPYAQVQGYVQPITYFGASELNPYLRQGGILPMTREWIRAHLGFQGALSQQDYKVAGEYRFLQQALLFQPESAFFRVEGIPTLHSVGVIAEGVWLSPTPSGLEGELRLAYRRWFLPTGWKYYSMPAWEGTLRITYRHESRLRVVARVHGMGARWLSNTQRVPAFVDISGEIHVQVWPFLSFFAEMNNLLNQRFYRWYGYRERPLDGRIGIWLKVG